MFVMYWGAFSTDIKKSSVNWTEEPEWMEKAVKYHNKIISLVVNFWKQRDPIVKIEKLPNCPEGDAFTFVFSHSNEKELRQKVLLICFDIQYMLEIIRNDGSGRLKIMQPRTFKTEEYFGALYIRIGVAFSKEPPIRYRYERYDGNRAARKKPESESYRGSVVFMSEEAEKRADYKLMPVIDKDPGEKFDLDVQDSKITFDPSKLHERTKNVPSIKECMYMLDDEGSPTNKLVYRDIRKLERTLKPKPKRRGSIVSRINSTGQINTANLKERVEKSKYKGSEALWKVFDENQIDLLDIIIEDMNKMDFGEKNIINAIMIFVKYRNVLDKSMAINNPYMIKYILEEYEDIHQLSNDSVYKFIKGANRDRTRRTYYTGGLVKQKRDDSSMYVIKRVGGKIKYMDMAKLFKEMARLLSILPHDSSIGMAYGELNEVIYNDSFDKDRQYVDYFGECVNLAARMEFKDFTYDTEWGKTKNLHKNRLALSSKDTQLMKDVEMSLEKQRIPLTVNHVPLKWLNLGKDDSTVVVLSSRLAGIREIKIGDTVSIRNSKLSDIQNKYTVLENKGFELIIQGKKSKPEKIPIDKLKL
jgi:hypothetical protein